MAAEGQALQEAMDAMGELSSQDQYKAKPALTSIGQDVNVTNMKMVLAGKQLIALNTGKMRVAISSDQFQHMKKSIVSCVKVGRTLFMVPKANLDLLREPDVQKWIENPADFPDLPQSFDAALWHLVVAVALDTCLAKACTK